MDEWGSYLGALKLLVRNMFNEKDDERVTQGGRGCGLRRSISAGEIQAGEMYYRWYFTSNHYLSVVLRSPGSVQREAVIPIDITNRIYSRMRHLSISPIVERFEQALEDS